MAVVFARYSFIILCFAFIYGCAKDAMDPLVRAQREKPDWISGTDDRYPLTIYLTGRSVSADLNKARSQATEDLAKSIDDQIALSMATYPGSESEKPHEHAESVRQKIEKLKSKITPLLDAKTREFLLQHIQIAETWEDPSTRAFHVLSTIDRVLVGDELLAEVDRLDEQIDRTLKKAEEEKDPLQRIAFAGMVIEKLAQREKQQAVVEIIKPIAGIAKSSVNRNQVEEMIARWMNDVKILPVGQHEEFNLLNAMKDGVTSAGMTVHFGAKPDYILKETFRQGQIRWKDGVYSVEGTLELELLDGEWKGQVRGDASWPIEVSALERDQLPGQLVEAIRQAHQKKLRPTLLSIENN